MQEIFVKLTCKIQTPDLFQTIGPDSRGGLVKTGFTVFSDHWTNFVKKGLKFECFVGMLIWNKLFKNTRCTINNWFVYVESLVFTEL